MPKDNDACLQKAVGWGKAYTCSTSTIFCESYGKDMKRCCPESCGSGVFTEEDCENYNGLGNCDYQNWATCNASGKSSVKEGGKFYF